MVYDKVKVETELKLVESLKITWGALLLRSEEARCEVFKELSDSVLGLVCAVGGYCYEYKSVLDATDLLELHDDFKGYYKNNTPHLAIDVVDDMINETRRIIEC